MTQGANNKPEIEDLDVLIMSRSLKPARVKLFGRQWTIKRDFTPEQIGDFWLAVDKPDTVAAMRMLVGDKDGDELAKLVAAAPTELITMPIRRIYQIAGLLKRPNDEGEDEGESSAS